MSELVANVSEKQKARIEFSEHIPFEGDMQTSVRSTVDVCNLVSSLFKDIMHDYYGCRIKIVDGSVPLLQSMGLSGLLYVDLFFKDRGPVDDPIMKNVKLRGKDINGNKDDLGSRFARVNGANNGRLYDVTNTTYEMLEEFMPTGERTRWADFTYETASPMGPYSRDEVVVCISGLMLDKIIGKIYGTKTEDGRYEYRVTPTRTMNNIPYSTAPYNGQEFVVQIAQLNLEAVRKAERSLGVYNSNSPLFHACR